MPFYSPNVPCIPKICTNSPLIRPDSLNLKCCCPVFWSFAANVHWTSVYRLSSVDNCMPPVKNKPFPGLGIGCAAASVNQVVHYCVWMSKTQLPRPGLWYTDSHFAPTCSDTRSHQRESFSDRIPNELWLLLGAADGMHDSQRNIDHPTSSSEEQP